MQLEVEVVSSLSAATTAATSAANARSFLKPSMIAVISGLVFVDEVELM